MAITSLGLPSGFVVTGRTSNAVAAIEHTDAKLCAVEFHPEVLHTEHGTEILQNFVFAVCGATKNWSRAGFHRRDGSLNSEASRRRARALRIERRRGLGSRGGVGASRDRRPAHKRLRRYRNVAQERISGDARTSTKRVGLNVDGVDASKRFLSALEGVTDPETKRKTIGADFIAVFAEEARKLSEKSTNGAGKIRFLVQGTLYPDVIESVSVKGPSATIKTHHNVGGLPKDMPFELIEPLRDLFKDEVRRIGRELGLPEEILVKHPFPGPGLAVRLIGEITRPRLDTLRAADAVVVEEIRNAGLYEKVWQAFAVLLPVRSVGVMGDGRTYGDTIVVRVVDSQDAMTADWSRLPREVLEKISTRVVNEVAGVNRVVYDISSKPPSTIEWE